MTDALAPTDLTQETFRNLEEAAKGMGFDTQRVWCTNFALSKGPGVALLIAREGINAQPPEGPPFELSRNLVSLVMPDATAVSLRDLLLSLYPVPEKGE